MSDATDNRFYREKQEQVPSKEKVEKPYWVPDNALRRMMRECEQSPDALHSLQAHVLKGICADLLDHRAAPEPPDCKQCDELIGERDRAQDALQDTHIALGGDGEWKGKLPPEPAPNSGDLHLDVPELARERMAELERLRASEPPECALSVLQSLSSYLGSGGLDCNDPEKLDAKIRAGIDAHIRVALERAAKAIEPAEVTTLYDKDYGTHRDVRQAGTRQLCADTIRGLSLTKEVDHG